MKVPLSWIIEFAPVPAELSPAEISDAFVAVGFEVDGFEIQGSEITGPLVVGRVISFEMVAGQKKPIRYVELDCDEEENRFVICGASNFATGDLVVVSLPGAVLPGGFAISARQTYGHTSNGMICSSRELGLSDDHEGIIVLSEGNPGDDAIDLLQMRDVIFDVAVNPDRGYALSIRGLAREIATSLNLKFTDPTLRVDTSLYPATGKGVRVSIDDEQSASVIYIRTVENFDQSRKTPLWMQRRIQKCGMRSISLAVDITNYVMLELGQPLHAFDAYKIDGSLHIRKAGSEKTFKTLDGIVRDLSPENLVVADDQKALALAGTMGGLDSEVTAETTSMAIEAARFNPIEIARNSRFHRLSSEASRRLERATDPALSSISSARAIELFVSLGGAKYLGTYSDGEMPMIPPIKFAPDFAQNILGIDISQAAVEEKLKIVGCTVSKSAELWDVVPPSWRGDIQSPIDLVEEIGRLIGLNEIPSRLPIGRAAAVLTPLQQRRRHVANTLAARGYSEVYNYPFVSREIMDLLGFQGARAASFKIANPMSEETPLLRTHLLPGLLDAAKRNFSRGSKNVALFEIGSVFRDVAKLSHVSLIPTDRRPTDSQINDIYSSVPHQPLFVAGVVLGALEPSGWWGSGRMYEWSDAVSEALEIVSSTGNNGKVVQSDLAPWHPGRCAEIQVSGKAVAHAGELHPRVLESLGLPPRSCAFAVILSELNFLGYRHVSPIFTMPMSTQDVSLIVDSSVPAIDVESALIAGAGDLLESISLFDRYENLGEGKVALGFTLVFRAPNRTLTAEEVSVFRENAVEAAAIACGAKLRS